MFTAEVSRADRVAVESWLLGAREKGGLAAIPVGLHSVPAELDEVAWDPESREITIVYVADFGFMRMRGCDFIALDFTGRIIAGEPSIGSIVDAPRPEEQPHAREWTLGESAGGR